MQELEIWKDITGYEGLYQVSNLGRVKSLSKIVLNRGLNPFKSKEKILKPHDNMQGYLFVNLYKEKCKKLWKIHHLVALMFLNHETDGTHKMVIDHINGNKKDNTLINLQIIDHRKNVSKCMLNNTSKITGVSFCKFSNKWRAYISFQSRNFNLGYFEKEEEAISIREKALTAVKNEEFTVFIEKLKGIHW